MQFQYFAAVAPFAMRACTPTLNQWKESQQTLCINLISIQSRYTINDFNQFQSIHFRRIV